MRVHWNLGMRHFQEKTEMPPKLVTLVMAISQTHGAYSSTARRPLDQTFLQLKVSN